MCVFACGAHTHTGRPTSTGLSHSYLSGSLGTVLERDGVRGTQDSRQSHTLSMASSVGQFPNVLSSISVQLSLHATSFLQINKEAAKAPISYLKINKCYHFYEQKTVLLYPKSYAKMKALHQNNDYCTFWLCAVYSGIRQAVVEPN